MRDIKPLTTDDYNFHHYSSDCESQNFVAAINVDEINSSFSLSTC